MNKRKSYKSEIKIDESTHQTVPTVTQRLKNSLVAIFMGFMLVQIFYFIWAFKTGNFLGVSAVLLIDNIWFLVYLAICAILGWFKGQKFINMLKRQMSLGKFWQ